MPVLQPIPHPRRALTRADLVVAVLTAGLLLGLFFPAVMRAQTTDKLLQCQNNLRQLGRAFGDFEKVHHGFPARRTGFGSGDSAKGGWGHLLLPHLAEALAKRYHTDYDFYDPINKAVTETSVSTFHCPSAPERTVPIKAKASGTSRNTDKDTLFSVNAAPNDYISSNGFFLPQAGYGLGWPRESQGNRHQAMDDDLYLPTNRITDGLSNTLIIIEQAGRPDVWRVGKRIDKKAVMDLGPNSRGAWAGFGSIAFGPSDRSDGMTRGRGDARDCSVNCNNATGIYGFHSGGANILLCDGSVRFVRESLNGLTFAQLTTRDDGQLISSADY